MCCIYTRADKTLFFGGDGNPHPDLRAEADIITNALEVMGEVMTEV